MANPNDILVSFQHPYKPTITNGIQCETGACAKWGNNELRRNYPGMSIGGHAWNRFRYGQVNDPSAYIDIKQGDLTDSTATTSNNSYKSQKSKQKKQKSNQRKWKSNNRKRNRKRLVSKRVPNVTYIE